jgi:hypothetical protein
VREEDGGPAGGDPEAGVIEELRVVLAARPRRSPAEQAMGAPMLPEARVAAETVGLRPRVGQLFAGGHGSTRAMP